MNELLHLGKIFDRLKLGYHLGPDDEPEFSALRARPKDYAAYFAALGLTLVPHEKEFYYFEPDNPENVPETLPKIAVFSYIIIDHAANQGGPIEEFVFGQNFLVTALPHFTLDRYSALLRQVDVHDLSDTKALLKRMEQIGWLKWLGEDEFRFLRPFHRVFSKCIEVVQSVNRQSDNDVKTSELGQTVLESAATKE